MSTAWLFPGQGSQYVGMAQEWVARSQAARDTLSEAADVLGFDLSALIAEGPEADLAETYNQQPAVFAASVAILRAAADELPQPACVAGHSLGEYSALVAAEALEFAEGLGLVRERGRLMRLAGEQNPGRMAAILGLSDEAVEEACAAVDGVQVANYNSPGQVVISGAGDAVDRASDLLREAGAKRIAVLPITIAAHSRLMAPVADQFAAAVEQAAIGPATTPVIANVTAQPVTNVVDIRAELTAQLTSSVRWSDTVRWMASEGVDSYYEIGPGKVLSGLVKRILKTDGHEPPEIVPMGAPVD